MKKIRPLEDWICLERIEYKHKSNIYVHGAITHKGVVVAVGPGKWRRNWLEVKDPVKGKSFRARVGSQTGTREPMDVKPGDIIEYSNQGWEERYIDGKQYIFTRQGSVIGFTDRTDSEGLQGHNSAIID